MRGAGEATLGRTGRHPTVTDDRLTKPGWLKQAARDVITWLADNGYEEFVVSLPLF